MRTPILWRFSSLRSRFLPEQRAIRSRARRTAQPQQAIAWCRAQAKQVKALWVAPLPQPVEWAGARFASLR